MMSMLIFGALIQLKAQPHHKDFDIENMSKMQTERMKKDLILTNKQTGEVSAINLKFAKKWKRN